VPTLSNFGTLQAAAPPFAAAQVKSARGGAGDQHAHYLSRSILQAGPLLFSTIIVAVLVTAFVYRHDGPLTAESGPGYWLGIIGAITMLLLTGYPLRKRLKSFARLGRVASWFRLHMILGILGPTLVILHTNFKLGSLNSRLALLTMLVVVASGIAGRYLYAKVHRGLYGKQVVLREILADIGDVKAGLAGEVLGQPGIVAELERFVPAAQYRASVSAAMFGGLPARASRRRIERLARQRLADDPRTRTWSRRRRRSHLKRLDAQLRTFFAAVRKAQRLAVFERLFGMWHHLHMPLFILLAMTVLLHIVAVHLY
jgi:hypothetical protein